MWQTILVVFGPILAVWATLKYLVLIEVRLDANTFKTLYEVAKGQRKFVVAEEFITEAKYPVIYLCLCLFRGSPWFYLKHTERLLTAGWSGKDSVTTVVCLRWRYRRLQSYLQIRLREWHMQNLGVPVEIITPHYTDKIGVLKHACDPPYQPNDVWRDIEAEADEVFAGTRQRSGALLFGPPGNGKTSLVKYLALKYRVPIKIITFSPDFSNHDLLSIFSQITSKCIVLFEDFDNYFDGRRCIIGDNNSQIKFTFDIILNGLDGVFNSYESVLFVMTVNDIGKVDSALRNRPSRFKFVRKFDNPTLDIRRGLLPEGWVAAAEGLNLDQVMRLKEYAAAGVGLGEAKAKLTEAVPAAKASIPVAAGCVITLPPTYWGVPDDIKGV